MKSIGPFLRRNSVTIGVLAIALVAGTILFLQSLAMAKLQEQVETQNKIIAQVKDITDQINQKAAERTEQINGIDKHLDCIVLFFTTEDRANRKITDIDTCQTTNFKNGSVLQGVAEPTTDSQAQTNTQPSTPVASNPQPTTSTSPQTPTAPEAPQPSFLQQLTSPITNAVDGITNFIKRL